VRLGLVVMPPFWEGAENPVRSPSRNDERRINVTIGREEMVGHRKTGRRADLRQAELGRALIGALNPDLVTKGLR
jgi:hypothetical protein